MLACCWQKVQQDKKDRKDRQRKSLKNRHKIGKIETIQKIEKALFNTQSVNYLPREEQKKSLFMGLFLMLIGSKPSNCWQFVGNWLYF